jgi:hypothetical protein
VTRAAVRAIALACVLAIVLAACSGGGGTTASTSSTIEGQRGYPPKNASLLEPLYRDELAALGLELTPRGGLIDRSGGGYEQSGSGTHLALYVEPTGARRSNEEYVAGILAVTKIFATDPFRRWPELESFDVCQEPPSAVNASDEPPPVTQIELTRAQAGAIDWKTVTVGDLIALSETPAGLRLSVSATLLTSAEYIAARRD